MIQKALRIKAIEFKGLKTRLHYRGAFFDVSIAPGTTTKFACIIAKKRIKRAVDRNKAKRKMYTALQGVTTKSPLYVFVYPTKNILETSQRVLKEEIIKAFATL